MSKFALLAPLAVVLAGCQSVTDSPAASRRFFTRAEVVRTHDSNHRDATDTRRVVADLGEVDRLASFFPGAGEGRTSGVIGSRLRELTVTFTRPDGSTLVVSSDYQWWGESRELGAWPTDPGFGEYFDRMFFPPPTASAGR